MPSTFSVGDVMDQAAVLNNDAPKSSFTYTALLPYVKIAVDELQQIYQLNNVPITNTVTTSPLVIQTNMTDIGGSTGPALPSDLVEIQGLYERTHGANEDYVEITKVEFLPNLVELTNELTYWTWQKQVIQFLGALTIRDVTINYIANSFGTIVDQTTIIGVFNAKNALAYRVAGLGAEFIGENPTRAQSLNNDASIATDLLLGVAGKGRQQIPVRRRPFMARHKSRGML